MGRLIRVAQGVGGILVVSGRVDGRRGLGKPPGSGMDDLEIPPGGFGSHHHRHVVGHLEKSY